MRPAALAAVLLLSCSRVPAGAGPSAQGGGGGDAGTGGVGGADPCAGATRDAWGFCQGASGPLDDACCPPVPPRPCNERVLRGCELDGLCRWLVPGCEEPALPEAGCFPVADCVDGACAEGLACTTVVVDPCQGRPCGADCSAPASVCLPPACRGDENRHDGVCLAPDGTEQPPACCTWQCVPHGIFCAAVPPKCPPGQVNAIDGGCWGPCIPPDRCLEVIEDLCRDTGGIWDEHGCGNADCGRPGTCEMPVPGCVCPITRAFVTGAGCQESDTCRAREGESCGRDIDLPCEEGLTCRGGVCRP